MYFINLNNKVLKTLLSSKNNLSQNVDLQTKDFSMTFAVIILNIFYQKIKLNQCKI